MPPKMKFESPLFHPNSMPLPALIPPHSRHSYQHPIHVLTSGSLPNRRSLHLYPAPPRRRQVWLRVRRRALVPRTNARDDPIVCDFDALEPERRESGECGGCEAVEGGSERV